MRGRSLALAVLACLTLGGASARIAATPAYDAWSWIGWGRELTHLDLVTAGGPSWKPLAALLAAPLSLLGGLAPEAWVALARAGGLAPLPLPPPPGGGSPSRAPGRPESPGACAPCSHPSPPRPSPARPRSATPRA